MRRPAVLLAGLAVLSLSACGPGAAEDGGVRPAVEVWGAAPSAAEETGPALAAAAAEALEQAGSARLQGTVEVDGQKTLVDVRVEGADLAGSFDVGGRAVQLVLVHGDLYMQAPEELWTAQGIPAAVASGLADTWVLAPPEAAAGLAGTTLATLAAEVREPVGATIARAVSTDELAGRPVWVLTASDGSALYVAAEGVPYPVQMTAAGDDGTARLSDFGSIEPIRAPSDFVDLRDVGR